jgi:hypothetical protein
MSGRPMIGVLYLLYFGTAFSSVGLRQLHL